MKPLVCPFCGIVSDHAHETQTACIEALQAEITRTRQVLERVTEPLRPPKVSVEKDSSVF